MPNELKKHGAKEPLRIPLDFEEALSDLLKVKPRLPEVKKEKKKDAPKK